MDKEQLAKYKVYKFNNCEHNYIKLKLEDGNIVEECTLCGLQKDVDE